MAAQKARSPRTDPAALLGEHLRQVRIDANFGNQAQLGTELSLERTAITKIETGDRLPSDINLNNWLDICGVTGRERALVKALCRLAHNKENPVEARTIPYYETEAEAHTLRYWAPLLIPGPVQTADYARAVFSAWRHSPERVEEFVKNRMDRQSVLSEDGPSVTIVLWEPVLRNLIGSPEVMRGQIGRLIELFGHRRVNIHVLPSSVGENMGLGGGISLATTDTDEALIIGGFSEDFVTSEPARVRAAAATFDGVRADALNRAASLEVLTEALERWSS